MFPQATDGGGVETFWITYRINDDADYDDRYSALIDYIGGISSIWWLESTSFILFESDRKATDIANGVKKAIGPRDLALLGMTNFKTYKIIGNPEHFDTLNHLLPSVKKV